MEQPEYGVITQIEVSKIYPHPDNPRKVIGDVSELAENIKVNGVLQNLTVVPIYTTLTREPTGTYTVVIGHRRLAAAKLAGLKTVPCVISNMTGITQRRTMLSENMQRADLTIIEQAQGFQMLFDLGDSAEQIAERAGFSETTVRRRLEIAKLDKEKLKKAEKRQISISDFDRLAKIEDLKVRNNLLDVLGTNNFENKYSDALSAQKFKAQKEKWLEVIRTFATEDPEASYQTKKYVRNYNKWSSNTEVEIPKDADTVKYYFKVTDYEIDLYIDRDIEKENAETAAWQERERLDKERRQALTEIIRRHYGLRSGFVAKLSKTDCKKHMTEIALFAAVALQNGNQIDYDSMVDTGIAVDEDNEDNLASSADVVEASEECPERLIAWFAYYSMDGNRNGYAVDRWNMEKREYETIRCDNSDLDMVYRFLCSLGYEMSDEEKAMQDGTHEVYANGKE